MRMESPIRTTHGRPDGSFAGGCPRAGTAQATQAQTHNRTRDVMSGTSRGWGGVAGPPERALPLYVRRLPAPRRRCSLGDEGERHPTRAHRPPVIHPGLQPGPVPPSAGDPMAQLAPPPLPPRVAVADD